MENSLGLKCPNCKSTNNHIIDSRPHTAIRKRRYVCDACGERFTTVEMSERSYKIALSAYRMVRKAMEAHRRVK